VKQEFYAETSACAFQWRDGGHENQFWKNRNCSSEGIWCFLYL